MKGGRHAPRARDYPYFLVPIGVDRCQRGVSLDTARTVMPVLDAMDVGWLEEPFAPHDYHAYAGGAPSGMFHWPLGRTTIPATNSTVFSTAAR